MNINIEEKYYLLVFFVIKIERMKRNSKCCLLFNFVIYKGQVKVD